MGLDKPKTIKGNAQGGILAAPAWTAFMNEVYRRKPAPPDWPRPEGIVIRQIDPASGMLAGPGCSPGVSEYFIAGTDPTQTCMPRNYGYDSTGAPIYVPPAGATVDTAFGFPRVPASIPRGTPLDTSRYPSAAPGTVVVPGAAPIPRAARPGRSPRDSARFPARDSLARPQRDTARPPRDTSNPFALPPE
jgi:penicillin-binding protein 1A